MPGRKESQKLRVTKKGIQEAIVEEEKPKPPIYLNRKSPSSVKKGAEGNIKPAFSSSRKTQECTPGRRRHLSETIVAVNDRLSAQGVPMDFKP